MHHTTIAANSTVLVIISIPKSYKTSHIGRGDQLIVSNKLNMHGAYEFELDSSCVLIEYRYLHLPDRFLSITAQFNYPAPQGSRRNSYPELG